jgi:histidine phosphotransfer protein HptB
MHDDVFDSNAFAELSALAGDDDSFLPELFTVFVQQGDEIIGRLTSAAQARDFSGFARASHTLAGSSSNVAAMRLADLCRAAEVRARQSSDELQSWRDRISAEYIRVADRAKKLAQAGEPGDLT